MTYFLLFYGKMEKIMIFYESSPFFDSLKKKVVFTCLVLLIRFFGHLISLLLSALKPLLWAVKGHSKIYTVFSFNFIAVG